MSLPANIIKRKQSGKPLIGNYSQGIGTTSFGVGAVAATAQAIVTGGLNLAIPALGFCVPAIFKLVESHCKRGEFRQKVPMSVFIDLSRAKGNK